MNAIVRTDKLPTARAAEKAVECYNTWETYELLPGTTIRSPFPEAPEKRRERRNRCLQTIEVFDRLAVTAPDALIALEVGRLIKSKSGAGSVSEDFVSILIDDLRDDIPEVSVMAVLRGFKKLRATETDFMPSTGKIISTIMAEEVEFRGAHSGLIRDARYYGYVGPERQIPPREPKRLVAMWSEEDDISYIPPIGRNGAPRLLAEGDTDGDLPD
jgi:hypothetical protein